MTKFISNCVVFLVNADAITIPNMQKKLADRGYKNLDKKDQLLDKIKRK